jgi:hypothetical protein
MPEIQSATDPAITPSNSRTVPALGATGDRVLVIVPAYNEAGTLPELLQSLRAISPTCEVLVVDDGSTDGTRQCVEGLARLISLPCNLGIGGAVQTGLRIALQENYDYAVQMDGDGQHPPQELEKLLRVARESGCDLVLGSRFRSPGGFKSTAVRRIGIRLFAWMMSGICGCRLTDPTSGFRVMSRRAITILARRYSEDFPEVEAIVQLHRAGLRIAEVPVQMRARVAGRSSIGPVKSLVYMLKVPLAIFMSLLRKAEEA